MVRSSHTIYKQFKSPLRVVVDCLHRSRETHKERVRKKEVMLVDSQLQLRESRLRIRELQRELDLQAQRFQELQGEVDELRKTVVRLPHDPKLPHHSFGPKMIAMCCNLALAVGFRPAEKALKIFWEFFGLDSKVPAFETIRIWLMRLGLARLTFNKESMKDSEAVWFVDHSCKVGTEKVMAVLGLRLEDLPPPGETLKHEDLMTLLVATGETWKREDVAAQYQALIEEVGAPIAVNSDEAIELQEPAKALKKGRKPVLVQTDPKHKLANIIKSVIGKDKKFGKFRKQFRQTRSTIQQTELSHFMPPRQKEKARFMNLQGTIDWAAMALWHLSHPNSVARANIETKRMNNKLGWLRSFRADIARWKRCINVVGATLKFINEQGLSVGASRRLNTKLEKLAVCESSRAAVERTLSFIRESEKKLKALKLPKLRLPMSTEVLESVFGRYKQLERQQNAGGFTSLLASFATLLKPIQHEEVTKAFSKISTKAMRQWVNDKLGQTLQSKKNQAYAEYKTALQAQQ